MIEKGVKREKRPPFFFFCHCFFPSFACQKIHSMRTLSLPIAMLVVVAILSVQRRKDSRTSLITSPPCFLLDSFFLSYTHTKRVGDKRRLEKIHTCELLLLIIVGSVACCDPHTHTKPSPFFSPTQTNHHLLSTPPPPLSGRQNTLKFTFQAFKGLLPQALRIRLSKEAMVAAATVWVAS